MKLNTGSQLISYILFMLNPTKRKFIKTCFFNSSFLAPSGRECKRNIFRNFIFIFFFFSFQTLAQTPYTKTINYGWTFSYEGKAYQASIPGCIHTDLCKNKLIPDPFYGNNDSTLQWIGKMDWVYENVFYVDTILWKKEEIELTFYGLDTYADVYLNDSLILSANNMFRTWTVNCKDYLHPQANKIKIIFLSAEKKSAELFKSYPIHLPSEERVMTRKSQYQSGWDFGPKFMTCGIWKKIEINGWDLFRIKSVSVQLDTINNNFAYLTGTLKIDATLASNLNIQVRDKSMKNPLVAYQLKTQRGSNEIQLNFEIKNPKLWWCNGYGEPFIYDLIFEITNQWGYHDQSEIKYGLRTIDLIETPDSAGNSFYFKLNNVPVFMKGANYVPLNIFPSAIRNSQYDSLIHTAVNSNFNMLRIWGGGIYEDEYFYTKCDENGILIWQDFMFACAMYPYDSLFLENVMQEANEQVTRLNNHPCLAIFCGNNEISEGWHRWGWQEGLSEKDINSIWKGYQKIFNNILPAAVKKRSALPYWESSPSFGRGDIKHTTTGDAHNWFVWHDGEPFENYDIKVPRFMSEFGFQSYPSEKCLNLFSKSNTDLFSLEIQSHQKNKNGNAIIKNYLLKYYNLPKNNDDFIYLSQVLQAEGIAKGIEAHRRNKPYCMGSLLWQFNDCWPAISWSSYDYSGEWKALQYFTKKSFNTFMISIEEKNDSIVFYMVSDSIASVSTKLVVNVFDFKGKKTRKKINLQIDSNSVKTIILSKKQLRLNNDNNQNHLIDAVLELNDQTIAEKIFYFGKPNQLPLNEPKFKLKSTQTPEGLTINISCDKPAKNVMLTSTSGGFFSDNFFDMLPDRTYQISLKNFSKESVPVIKIKTIFGTR